MKSSYFVWRTAAVTFAVLLFSASAGFAQNTNFIMEDDPFATETSKTEMKVTIPDPFYRFNRRVFKFNDGFYFNILKPTVHGYKTVTPLFFRKSIQNFFLNLLEPVYFVNSILQGRSKDAGTSLGRFLCNSTLGVGGLFDPARLRMEATRRTFDQTFAKWGIKPGAYIVWPFIGPSSFRGTMGLAAEEAMDPFNYGGGASGAGASVLETVNETGFHLGAYEDIKKYSVDDYSAIKDIYEKKIHKKAAE